MARDRTSTVEVVRGQVQLPERQVKPIPQILRRLGYALIVLAAVTTLVMIERDGYKDNNDTRLDWIDAFYYATVTLSTTGYGDIVPVSDIARLTNILVVTPLRIAFLAIVVGTAFEVLGKRYRDQLRTERWREKLQDHTVVIGYGTKGYNAILQLKASGLKADQVVVVDNRRDLITEANRDGYAAVLGDATRGAVLRKAGVPSAQRVIIATTRDDTAVLATLTARQLNPNCVVVASIREAENEPLLLRSGADAVVTSSEAAGRLLGVAAFSPVLGEVFTDLLVHGDGLELFERDVEPQEVGRGPTELGEPVIAILRSGHAIPYKEIDQLLRTDRLVVVGCKPRNVESKI